MKKIRAMLVYGTRPEAIKMAPVVQACERHARIEPIVVSTGQHREMLEQVNAYFGLKPQVDLDLMRPDQSLAEFAARCLAGVDRVLAEHRPDCIVAQGDTTTVMAASLAAFYRRTPLVHVEAGLRTGDLHAPWPEELNRRVTSLTAAVHCAPTRGAADNLLREGAAADTVHVTGNTVIDALLWAVERERAGGERWQTKYASLGERPMVLITGHRRENFGSGFENICQAIAELAGRHGDTVFLYPVHLNPRVREPAHRLLDGKSNVWLAEPAGYAEFVWLMDRAHVILTDSGGVQEEAPSLGKPVLVMRDTTERPEAVAAGAAELVGTDVRRIVESVSRLLTDEAEYRRRLITQNPYGDGHAAQRIAELIADLGEH